MTKTLTKKLDALKVVLPVSWNRTNTHGVWLAVDDRDRWELTAGRAEAAVIADIEVACPGVMDVQAELQVMVSGLAQGNRSAGMDGPCR
jgi:hypothetical protein